MTITQTVEISENRQVTIEIPSNWPTGRANVIIQFPVPETLGNSLAINKMLA